jgi:hypothetical protein
MVSAHIVRSRRVLFLRGGMGDTGMWREVANSGHVRVSIRLPRRQRLSVGPPPNRSAQALVLSTTGCRARPVKARQVSRCRIRNRAWGRSEPVANQSAARAVECMGLARSGVDWASQPRRSLESGCTRLRRRTAVAGRQLHALGRKAVSMVKMQRASTTKGGAK